MFRRLSSVVIFAGLVATPAADLHAQTNPWYIPPQPPAQAQAIAPGQQHALPQGYYMQAPQSGFGAAGNAPGYVLQQQAPAAILVPQNSAVPSHVVPSYGYIQQPTTTGTVGSLPAGTGAPVYATPPQSGGVAHQPAPAYAAPQFAPQTQAVPQPPPTTVYVLPQQPQAAQTYSYQPQVFGNYPPLGSDPTVPAQPPAPQHSQTQQTIPAAPTAAPLWGSIGAPMYPGLAGPTTMLPGHGGYPGLSPIYPAPFGATPFLGLPFY